jgi:hypothetical protein
MAGGAKPSFALKTRRQPLEPPAFFPLRVTATQISNPASGPFVYRLGHLVFNQARGVRLPYGLPLLSSKIDDRQSADPHAEAAIGLRAGKCAVFCARTGKFGGLACGVFWRFW